MSTRDRDRSRNYGRDRRSPSDDDRYSRYDRHHSRGRDRRSRSRDRRSNSKDRRSRSRDRRSSSRDYRSRSRDRRSRSPVSRRGDTGIRDDGRYVHARKSRDTSKIQSERLAVLKKLTNDGNSSDEEEGAIGTTGSSGIQSETVFTAGADEVDEKEIMRVMGFGGFDSTKEKPVEDNFKGAALGAAAKNKRRIYRQYMNRRGGFNRPLQKLD
mmetsp:Transcript_14098/g.21086  ORF Transcript_14098/g.21086 Transcript_14098/m.21086 type:complete len:212 (-) Transcript_14098:44-679(-)